jgi:hypothetical protein
MAKNKINISPIISPDIVKTIDKSSPIKSFGSQTKDKNKEILIVGDQTKTAQLDSELNLLTEKEQEVGVEKSRIEEEAIYKFNTKQITQDQYNAIIKASSATLLASKALLDKNKIKIQQDKNNINNNPYTPIKNNLLAINNEIKNADRGIKRAETKSKKSLVKQVLSNSAKNLTSIISLQLSNNFTTLIFQRKKLEELVDQINLYIDTQVKDESTFAIATNLRNNAISLINSNISKLDKIKGIIDTTTAIITIFNAIIPFLNISAALPVISTPPGTPIPGIIIHDRIRDRKFNLQRLLSSLGGLLAISSILLANEIDNLIELRGRLEEVSLKLDNKALEELSGQQISTLSDIFLPVGVGIFPPYRGFNFKIKEEQNNPQSVVKGNKRKYAVAIDRYGVEILKSEYSFTQDPSDLIEQLKLVIDQQNLQG